MFEGDEIIKRGTWLYAGSVPSAVVIARNGVFFGSGDHEDSPEVREDREVETFRIWFETPPGSGEFKACGGQFLSLQDAVAGTARLVGYDLRWE